MARLMNFVIAGKVPYFFETIPFGITLVCIVTSCLLPIHPVSANLIGNTIAAPQNIANGPIRSKPISYRFQPKNSTGCVKSLNTWWRYNKPDDPDGGYSSGNGGLYSIEIQTDNNGAPSGTVLESTQFQPDIKNHPNYPNTQNAFRTVDFSGTTCLKSNYFYHILIRNIHNYPDDNYVSFNGPYLRDTYQNLTEFNSCKNCKNPLVLLEISPNNWVPYPNKKEPTIVYQPFWCLSLTDGTSLGQPVLYGHLVTNQPKISGKNSLRQKFVTSNNNYKKAKLYFYAKKNYGAGELKITINQDEVAELNLPTIDQYSVQDAREFDWYHIEIDKKLVFGASNTIQFSTDQHSEYEISTVVKAITGNCAVNQDFSKAEFSNDGGKLWMGLSVFGQENHPAAQLSVFLEFDEI